jgi:uncharacterized protein
MRETLRRDLTSAMKARDVVAVAALRSALAAIDNAEAVDVAPAAEPAATSATSAEVAGAVVGVGAAEVPRRVLTAADVERLVRGERDDRITAAVDHERLGRSESAGRLRAEAGVLALYLPDGPVPDAPRR